MQGMCQKEGMSPDQAFSYGRGRIFYLQKRHNKDVTSWQRKFNHGYMRDMATDLSLADTMQLLEEGRQFLNTSTIPFKNAYEDQ